MTASFAAVEVVTKLMKPCRLKQGEFAIHAGNFNHEFQAVPVVKSHVVCSSLCSIQQSSYGVPNVMAFIGKLGSRSSQYIMAWHPKQDDAIQIKVGIPLQSLSALADLLCSGWEQAKLRTAPPVAIRQKLTVDSTLKISLLTKTMCHLKR